MRSAAVPDRKAAHPFRRQETASEVRDRPKCCSPYQERRPMKPWQSQPGGQAVGKRPAEWALHGGFFSRPTHLGRRGQRPAGLSRLIRARKFPAPLRACGASRERSYRGFRESATSGGNRSLARARSAQLRSTKRAEPGILTTSFSCRSVVKVLTPT